MLKTSRGIIHILIMKTCYSYTEQSTAEPLIGPTPIKLMKEKNLFSQELYGVLESIPSTKSYQKRPLSKRGKADRKKIAETTEKCFKSVIFR